MSEQRCGTCKFYGIKPNKSGIKLPTCLMTNRVKTENEGRDCWGWKPGRVEEPVPSFLR